ncbi:uncharacterized protein L199_000747 [Kwoniella botswanensis]|uniref:uncharacterized protein n=1 Tax=Kwoniella botswanensis TaxID=1268659 RepID=UPI00315D05C3
MPPKSRSKQTTLFSHFDHNPSQAGPSRTRTTRNVKPLFDRASDSEGSEGLDHIKLNKDKKPKIEDLPMTQKRKLRKTVQDSESDFDDQDEDEEDFEVAEISTPKRKGRGGGKRKHRDEALDTDPDEEFISYPLQGYIHPNYRGTPSQKFQRRNDRLEAVEIARKKKREENLTDDEIEVFPSPPRRGTRKTRERSTIDYDESGKGKGKARDIEEEEEDDDIIPISPPTKRGRGRPPKSATSAKPPSSSSTKPLGRPRLNLKRTRSEVIVEISRMSQEERRSYTPLSISQSSESKTSSNGKGQGKGKAGEVPESSSSRERGQSKLNMPIVEIRSRRASPDHGSVSNDSLPPILEVELSDKDLDILTDNGKEDVSKRGSTRSKSPIKKSSPIKRPSPSKPSSASRNISPILSRRPSPSRSPSSDGPVAVVLPFRKLDKGKGKQKAISSSDIGSEEEIIKKKKSKKPAPLSLKSSNKHNKASVPAKKGRAKHKIVDPDDDDTGAATEEEENMVDDLQMDEPERFKSATRLRERPKETAAQRNIRKLKNRRLGIVESTTEDDSDSDESLPTPTDARNSGRYSDDDFIVADDSMAVQVQLPHEFSVDSAQTPEFKFKVVFHYLVMLVMRGKKAFPLSSESSDYFVPQLAHFRDRMTGYRQLRVRSQIWRSNFVKALERYPIFDVEELLYAEPGCDACHMGGRMSRFRVTLDGEPYNKETHQPLDSSSESESEESENSDVSEATKRNRKKSPNSLLMGRFCKQRAEVFHQMTHWEDELYHRIRGYYRDLLRAKYKPVTSDSEASTPESEQSSDEDQAEVKKRREDRKQRKIRTEARCEKLRKKGLPEKYKDVDAVTEWMDKMGYQNKDFRWIERLIETSGQLEHDKRKDE